MKSTLRRSSSPARRAVALAALVAAGCGTAVDDGFWSVAGEGLSGTPGTNVSAGAWVNASKTSVVLTRPAGTSGAFTACVVATAPDAAAPFAAGEAWGCAAPAVAAPFGASAATATVASLTLPAGEGLRKVWAKFSDKSGTGAKVASVDAATVLVDTTPPVQSDDGVTIAGDDAAIVVTLVAGARDVGGSGVGGYKVVQNLGGSAPPAGCATGTPLVCRASRNVLTCGNQTNGTKSAVRVCAVDRAGNAARGIVNDYVVPMPGSHRQMPPAGITLTLTAAPTPANRGKATLTIGAVSPDGTLIRQYCLAEAASACVFTTARTPAATLAQTATVTLADAKTSGPRTLVARVRDAYGLVGSGTLAFDFDATPPDDAAVVLGVTAVDRAFLLKVTAGPPDAAGYVVSAVKSATAEPVPGCVAKAAAGTSGVESVVLTKTGGDATAGWTFDSSKLTSGSVYRVRVCAVDAAGNVSPGSVSGAVTYVVAPTGSIVVGTGTTTQTALTSSPVKVTLKATANGGAKAQDWALALDENAPKSWTPFAAPAATATQTIAAFDLGAAGPKTLFAWFRDNRGVTSNRPVTAQTFLDARKPVVSFENPGAVETTADAFLVSVGVVVDDDSEQLKSVVVKLFPGPTATGTGQTMVCTPTAALTFDCTAAATVAAGKVSFQADVTDAAGRAADKVLLENVDVAGDTTPPGGFDPSGRLDVSLLSRTSDDRVSMRLDWDAATGDDVFGYVVVREVGLQAPPDCQSGIVAGQTKTTSLRVDDLEGEVQAFRVCAADAAVNLTEGRTVRYGTPTSRVTRVGNGPARPGMYPPFPALLTGVAEPGVTVDLYDMGRGHLATVTTGADARWSWTLEEVGPYDIVAVAHAAGGDLESPEAEFGIGWPLDAIVSAKKVFSLSALAPASTRGTSGILSPLDTLALTGTGAPGGRVRVVDANTGMPNAGRVLATTRVSSDGLWTTAAFGWATTLRVDLLDGKGALRDSATFPVQPSLNYDPRSYMTDSRCQQWRRYVAGSVKESPAYRGRGTVDGTPGVIARFNAIDDIVENPKTGHVVVRDGDELFDVALHTGAVKALGTWAAAPLALDGDARYFGAEPTASGPQVFELAPGGTRRTVWSGTWGEGASGQWSIRSFKGEGDRLALLLGRHDPDEKGSSFSTKDVSRIVVLQRPAGGDTYTAVGDLALPVVQRWPAIRAEDLLYVNAIAFGPGHGLYVATNVDVLRVNEAAATLEATTLRPLPDYVPSGEQPFGFDAAGMMHYAEFVADGRRLFYFDPPPYRAFFGHRMPLLTRRGHLIETYKVVVRSDAPGTAFEPATAAMLTVKSGALVRAYLGDGGGYRMPLDVHACGPEEPQPPAAYESCADGATAYFYQYSSSRPGSYPSALACVCTVGVGNGFNRCSACGGGAHQADAWTMSSLKYWNTKFTASASGTCACDAGLPGDAYAMCGSP